MKHFIHCGVLIVQCLVLFVDINVAEVPTTNNVIVRQCTQDGGYCQNSWDCCSDRCLSFSYKCVKGPPSPAGAQPYAPSAIRDPTLISVDTLEDLVNRFGGDDDKTLAKPTATSSSTSTSTPSSTIQAPQCIGIGYACADSSECCSNDCLHYENVHICIEKRTPTTTTVPPNGQCLQIGQKCYRHEECCTERCHGFLHQCVT